MFFKQDPQLQIQTRLRRICNATVPNLPCIDDCRGDSRQNRTIPVLLVPWEGKSANTNDAATALTRDISDRGISVTLPGPFRVDQLVVGFWLPQILESPFFFLGAARQTVPIGGGFWALGIEATQELSGSEVEPLMELIKQILPPQSLETEPPSALLSGR